MQTHGQCLRNVGDNSILEAVLADERSTYKMDQKVRFALNLEARLEQGCTDISLQLIVLPTVFHPR